MSTRDAKHTRRVYRDKERSSMLDAKGTSAAGEEEEDEAMSVSKADLSLKQGEKIKISIGGASKVRTFFYKLC